MKSRKIVGQICPIFSLLFRTFSLWLETIDKLKCSPDNMSKTRRYVVNMEHCQNYISVYHSHPIAGRRSEIVFKHTGSQSVTYILPNKYRKKDNLDFNWFENTIAFSLFLLSQWVFCKPDGLGNVLAPIWRPSKTIWIPLCPSWSPLIKWGAHLNHLIFNMSIEWYLFGNLNVWGVQWHQRKNTSWSGPFFFTSHKFWTSHDIF